jgi:hypothetical protein
VTGAHRRRTPAPAKKRRYSADEVEALLAPLAEPEDEPAKALTVKPNYSPPTFVPPPLDYLPPGVTARAPGVGEFPAPPPAPKPRRLRVVSVSPLGQEQQVFEFGDLGGFVTVYAHGRGPDPYWRDAGCLGRFSPFSTQSMALEGDELGRRLVCVEADGTERVVAIDEREPPSLLVEVVQPDEREPWVTKTRSQSFELSHVTVLVLEDCE